MDEAELKAITDRKEEADRKLARLMRLRNVLNELDHEDSGERIDRVLIDFTGHPSRYVVRFKRSTADERDCFTAANCLQSEEGLPNEIRAALRAILERRIDAAAKEFEAV